MEIGGRSEGDRREMEGDRREMEGDRRGMATEALHFLESRLGFGLGLVPKQPRVTLRKRRIEP